MLILDLQAQSVSPPAEYSVRLVNGPTSCSGTVEVFYRGEWLVLCTGWWSMIEAKVVCRQMGCGNATAESGGPMVEEGRGGVMVESCNGDESTITRCDISGGPGVCNGEYYHNVMCSAISPTHATATQNDYINVKAWNPDIPSTPASVKPSLATSTQDTSSSLTSRVSDTSAGLQEGDTTSDPTINTSAGLQEGDTTSDVTINTSSRPTTRTQSTPSQDLPVQPDISLTDSMGGVSRGHEGPEVFRGHSFTITCSTQPQYPGGSFLLTFTGSNRTQTQPAVNHSAAFLFPAADDSHQGNYSCVYDNYVFSHNFSSESELLTLTVTASPLPAFIIRHVVVLLILLTAITTFYLYYKTTRRQKRVNRVSSMDLYVDANAMEMVSLSSRAEAGPGEERAAQGTE
ncbi:soluble scavenger receptor cysteine-rich domain-containing protein SSC5D-like [Coregonus clupeaformis]|uniref:soluble scavenger receptor cysteine-rich domain-containing protein SSC5D-like n=1 Tax=Coregonus clupeaformis TaxID=59861 RepID=UPI001E1C80E6|nr:soluble scavenger receptor cysteine-rich domain-containing protein SSC5D-like [Coregonus clupeaformis]